MNEGIMNTSNTITDLDLHPGIQVRIVCQRKIDRPNIILCNKLTDVIEVVRAEDINEFVACQSGFGMNTKVESVLRLT